MNILHIISAPASGGAEVYVKDLAKYLSKQGHVLHVAFLSTASDANRDLDYEQQFLDDLKLSSIETFFIGNETRKKPWLGILRVRKYVKENNIDICHTHLAYGILFSALNQVPIAYTHHSIRPRWNKLTYKLFDTIVNEYIGISDMCADALAKYTNREVITITNAVSQDKFEGYVRKRTLKDTIYIAMVGRLTVQKDYMTMLRALSLLDKKIQSRVKVVVAGEGEYKYKQELLGFINKYDLKNVVEFIGVTTDIPKFLYQSDVFLMTSLWEGLPISLTEAAISGLPCIVTDVGGCSEIINNSQNGVCVASDDPHAIADEITRFFTDEDLIERYSRNALDNAYKYSIDLAAAAHMKLYDAMLLK